MKTINFNIEFLKEKCRWVRKETLKIHKTAPQTRLASSLSSVELFVALYYGGIIKFDPKNINWEKRDRFIISKGHGSISMYPILADLGFFGYDSLISVCKEGSFLGGIPDPIIPGYETINGSLGHGLGVGCGMAIALKRKNLESKVYVLLGDGELNEGAIWEAIMFAAHNNLDNLIAIIDYNKISMLDYTKNIINLYSLKKKFCAFNWDVEEINGHNIEEVIISLKKIKSIENNRPKAIIAHTIKGFGVSQLEANSLSHVISLSSEEVDKLLKEYE